MSDTEHHDKHTGMTATEGRKFEQLFHRHHDRLTGMTVRKGEWGKALILMLFYVLLYIGGGWLAIKFLAWIATGSVL